MWQWALILACGLQTLAYLRSWAAHYPPQTVDDSKRRLFLYGSFNEPCMCLCFPFVSLSLTTHGTSNDFSPCVLFSLLYLLICYSLDIFIYVIVWMRMTLYVSVLGPQLGELFGAIRRWALVGRSVSLVSRVWNLQKTFPIPGALKALFSIQM